MKPQLQQHLIDLQMAMRLHNLWEASPPSVEAMANPQPFCVESLTPTQWLQWIFIPRMQALLDADAELPRNFAITPYLEETLKNEPYLHAVFAPVLQLELLLKD